MNGFSRVLAEVNGFLWQDRVLYAILAVGVLFTLWSGVCQVHSLTHGVALIRGRYARPGERGALTHFQALSTALSATVGLGNIAGVAIGVSVGGPGAVFWMWVTGFVGMALKTFEVTQAMLYRNVDRPDEPHGGAMWVASRGFARLSPRLAPLGKALAVVFCLTLLVSTVTGGNMFQAWNVADVTWSHFGVPRLASGVAQALIVGLVILGGIRRIGQVTERLVPFMCGVYLLAGLLAIALRIEVVPAILRDIFVSAFRPAEAQGAFLGGAMGWAFLKGMQRSLFSNEAGQGSSPIAHSAARTDEPVREGIVAGLEPFVDTIVVCTITALVILSSGVWNREPDLAFASPPAVVASADGWTLAPTPLDAAASPAAGQPVFAVVEGDHNPESGNARARLAGVVTRAADGAGSIVWEYVRSESPPALVGGGAWLELKGATLTARAFDRVVGGLGTWMVPLAVWLFAISTMISWSYYGEQGIVYLLGSRAVRPYRLVYCGLILLACTELIRTERELDDFSTLGTGVMLFANVPIMLVFSRQAIRAYRDYVTRLERGEFEA
jgi:AGCS family alanine or glycine:cation symporter